MLDLIITGHAYPTALKDSPARSHPLHTEVSLGFLMRIPFSSFNSCCEPISPAQILGRNRGHQTKRMSYGPCLQSSGSCWGWGSYPCSQVTGAEGNKLDSQVLFSPPQLHELTQLTWYFAYAWDTCNLTGFLKPIPVIIAVLMGPSSVPSRLVLFPFSSDSPL